VTVERIHACKLLIATIARVGTDIEVQRFVALAIVLPSETLTTALPLATIRSVVVVGTHVTVQVELARKCASTPRDRAHVRSIGRPPLFTGHACRSRRHERTGGRDGGESGSRWPGRMRRARRVAWARVWRTTEGLTTFMTMAVPSPHGSATGTGCTVGWRTVRIRWNKRVAIGRGDHADKVVVLRKELLLLLLLTSWQVFGLSTTVRSGLRTTEVAATEELEVGRVGVEEGRVVKHISLVKGGGEDFVGVDGDLLVIVRGYYWPLGSMGRRV